MSSRKVIETAAGALRNVSALAENRFCEIGKNLESATEILADLTDSFSRLSLELESDRLREATCDLSDAAGRIATLASAQQGTRAVLDSLTEMTGAIGGRVSRMRKAVKAVDVLAINAKIAAANITGAGDEFISFASEIGRSLKLAQVNLDRFDSELSGVAETLHAASAGESELGKHRQEAVRAVPNRLAESVSAIAERRGQAAAAALAVGDKADEIGRRVGEAVMALQVSDIARQRMEHAEYALGLLQRLGAGQSVLDGGNCDIGGLDDRGRRALTASGCRLQAAQLNDAADELERESRQVLTALAGLAADAREITHMGLQAYGASHRRRGAFLLELEEDVAQAQQLIEKFRDAQEGADHVVQSVRDATAKLVRNINTIQSLEADTRIMGLNTTLKCGRIGEQGRSLTIIAQELRICSNLTAVEAAAVMTDLQAVAARVDSLTQKGDAEIVAEITAVGQLMSDAIAEFGAVGQTLAEALAGLSAKSDAVAGLLDRTQAQIGVHEQIGSLLRRTAGELERLGDAPSEIGEHGAAWERLSATMSRSYTMAREREIHNRMVHGEIAPETAAPQAELEDIFF